MVAGLPSTNKSVCALRQLLYFFMREGASNSHRFIEAEGANAMFECISAFADEPEMYLVRQNTFLIC